MKNNPFRRYGIGAIVSAVLFSAAIIAAAVVLANAWRKTHLQHEIINVKGLSKKDFTSDLIVWRGSFTRKSLQMKDAYNALKGDQESIRRYLAEKGIKTDEIVFSSVDIQKEFDEIEEANGRHRSVFNGYRLTQNVSIESKEVDKVEKIAREVTELIDAGVELSSPSPEYYYTGLASLKIEMLAEATKDARNRAEKIAENAGSHLGDLRSAEMGIFQITAQNSAEEYTWGGAFNTSAKKKTASVTVSLEFGI